MRTEACKNGDRSASVVETHQSQVASPLPDRARLQESTEPPGAYAETVVQGGIVGDEAPVQLVSRDLLSDVPLPAEADFYNRYRWCLDACPVLREVVNHLWGELAKLDQVLGGWQQSEVITNIFLLSCSITDTIDDYLLGNAYDFSKLGRAFPWAKPGVYALETLVSVTSKLRRSRLVSLYRWKEVWRAAVTTFLNRCFVAGVSDRAVLLEQRNQLAQLLRTELPKGAEMRRAKIPAFFRSRDFAPHDCLELGLKLIASLPEDRRPVIVMGLRTAGSFLAPLLCAFLSRQLLHAEWLAVRPSKGLTAWEKGTLLQAAQKKARMIIVASKGPHHCPRA